MKLLLISLLLLMVGCVPAPQATNPASLTPSVPADSSREETPWVQFGTVVWRVDVLLPSTSSTEGVTEPAMNLTIRMDFGEEIQLVQAVSQAGRLSVGDRVRVLKIGDFTRVTYWPYNQGQSSPATPSEN